ncbi:branched-chain amino acid ABC transporter substrate-binding protein [Bradyrhizobium sp. CCBAU 051011]|jgi:branched-chain amino acid transport system substrate-binding protein|uniref:ABC transporter substrate-binding protein n=1 Tax=Bradyrhizobium sp. CCBAU 051011 TaxID=858422 RepID=UPI00137441F4|nr:ABC transporter substrate-binding protein [Bradyrhizobium sp. CCBAU 051011]QHO77173.1 branched-chain amino acid ABC transporter substrate-binding protein [Bradyrhizobium sp. CCBAU 051011]
MNVAVRLLIALAVALTSLGAMSPERSEQPADETEIRIGNLMPYSGKLAEFAAIGRAQAAYFDMINAQGGINGRKIRFISRDDNSDPTVALDMTRKLVEQDNVHLIFGSFGTPGNLAIRRFLNEKKIPQLFPVSGADELSDPKAFPWTMGWQPSSQAAGRIYANYIQATYPQRKIVIVWQNDHFGNDLHKGIQKGLGDLKRMIIVGLAFDVADEHIDGHVSILKRSGAEILLFAGVPTAASQVIRFAADLHWHPALLLNDAAASIGATLGPAGAQKSAGVISATFLKDPTDPAWKDDPAIKNWLNFMDKYYPDGDKGSGAALYGYAAAETLVQVLKQCGNDLSRENIMRQAASLKDFEVSVLLPGIKVNTGTDDYRPIKQMRLVQFDGRTWQLIGDVIDTAFTDGQNK